MKPLHFFFLIAMLAGLVCPAHAITTFNVEGLEYCPVGDGNEVIVSSKRFTPEGRIKPMDYSNLTQIVIPSQVTYDGKDYKVVAIDYEAFCECGNLERVTIAPTVASIGESAFGFCEKLEYLLLPEGVVSVGDNAFQGCLGLRAVSIPGTLVDSGPGIFSECENLQVINLRKNPGDENNWWNVMSMFDPQYVQDNWKCIIYAPAGGEPGHAGVHYNIHSLNSPADIHTDGITDVSDVNVAIDMVLGRGEVNILADVNGDGVIDVADINQVIDEVLGVNHSEGGSGSGSGTGGGNSGSGSGGR